MRELLRKIEVDATKRLPLPPGRKATQELPRYAAFLKVETHRLKLAHRAGASGGEVCGARAGMIDLLLRHLWDAAKSSLTFQAQKEFPPLALVAIGGYGRGELNPHSDIDFMFLQHRQVAAGGRPLPHLSRLIDEILYPLWDLRLKVGHTVRSIDDCVREANGDMQSKTALIEARFIIGDEGLFKRFQKTLLAKCVDGHLAEYNRARLADQAARRAKFGNSACMQEPNIKSGCGGLRDFQNLIWMTFFKYRTRSLAELKQDDLITESERRQLETAYGFLLRVRTEVHYHTNRSVDVLSKNIQPAVAHNLGYTERSPSKRIEEFMRDVYSQMRNIYLITRMLEQRLALLPQPEGRLSLKRFLGPLKKTATTEPVDGFRFVKGQILGASNRIFRDQPRRLMRVFLHAQQRGLQLHPDLAQMIRNQISLADRDFRNDENVRETFLQILNHRGNVARTLRAMHEVDLLGKYIPEFGKLTCLVQHEFYHQYTADEHTLMCLEQLDRVWTSEELPHRNYTPLLQDLEQPHLLYLALLLHDVAKPKARAKHSEAGARIALQLGRRLGLDEPARQTLARVIGNHLLMASVSQRRDMDDPAVMRSFARAVQTPETLALLTLHTFVDSLATSNQLWNGFKDSLLWDLYSRAMPLLTGGTEFVRGEELHRERLMEEIWRMARGRLPDEEVQAHFRSLPPRYFQIHTADKIFLDLQLVHRFMSRQIGEADNPLEPIVHWQADLNRGGNFVKVCTWDRAGLFGRIAGALSASGLNILSAQVFTRNDGIALDTFFVTDARDGSVAQADQRERFEKLIARNLSDESTDLSGLIARQKSGGTPYRAYTGERLATKIVFDNDASETRTLIEIECEDHIGLLRAIAKTFAELELDISAARICTEMGAAIDTFYVHEIGGGKIVTPERLQVIERRLRSAIHALDRSS